MREARRLLYHDAVISSICEQYGFRHYLNLPYGEAIAIANLLFCYKTEDFIHNPEAYPLSEDEKRFGDFSPGRYAWRLENVRTIEPFPVKGRQGLFEVEMMGNP